MVSHANAWGLMQLLPSVGKSMAKKEGLKGFNTNALLNPTVNLQLGHEESAAGAGQVWRAAGVCAGGV